MAGAFGIDFGTTNSAVVEFINDRFVNIGDLDGNPFPSVVAIDNLTEKVSCGREVRDRIIEIREGGEFLVFESAKTFLAEDRREQLGERTITPEYVATELFRSLSARAERIAGEPIGEAVVAIPVGMTSEKRASLRKAARAAGIDVQSFVSEPTAALVSHADSLRHCKYVAVFDWGGGTLDISILELQRDCIIERYNIGWDKAGDHIDKRLAEQIHRRMADELSINTAFHSISPNERQILINQSERCKRRLQQQESYDVIIGHYADHENLVQSVSQHDFDDLIGGIVSYAIDLLIASVEKAGLAMKEIGRLIVVGGSSRLSLLQRELKRQWPDFSNIIFPEEAEWDVARGAAWLAAHPGSYRTAESVGLVLADGDYYDIFPSGTRLGDAKSRLHFGLVEDSPTATFLFASKNGTSHQPNHIGELHVEAFGLRDELIYLDTRISDDLVLEAAARSDSKPQDASRQFGFNNLKWMYEISSEE